MNDVRQIDPEWAWRRWEPQGDQPWNRRRAAHLLRRAGFGATSRQLDDAVRAGLSSTVEQLLSAEEDAATARQIDDLSTAVLATGNVRGLPGWWLYRMVHSPCPLREQMTLLWHSHLATSGAKVTDPRLLLDQHQLLRRHALGNFGQLAHGIARDPAMLLYLDSATNRRSHPNENFARELMELFCLGLGHYTERDIQQLARCFTGWEIHNSQFRFNRFQHDPGEKEFLGRRGKFGGDEGVDIVLEQEAVASLIVGKVVKHLVLDEPELPAHLLAPLCAQFRASKYELAPLVKTILESRLFHSEWAVARKVRSPVELAVGWLRALGGTTNMPQLAEELGQLGQLPFFPPNVKGWPGGRAWLNSATVVGRGNLIRRFVDGNSVRFSGGSLANAIERAGWTSPAAIVDGLAELLMAPAIPDAVRTELTKTLESTGDRSRGLADVLHAMSWLPEFHLG